MRRAGLGLVLIVLALGLAATATGGPAAPAAIPGCAKSSLNLVEDGQLSLGTDNPAFPPWWGGAAEEAVAGLESRERQGLRVRGRVRGREAARLLEGAGRVERACPSTTPSAPARSRSTSTWRRSPSRPSVRRTCRFSNSYYFVNQAVVANAGTPISTREDGRGSPAVQARAPRSGRRATTTSRGSSGRRSPRRSTTRTTTRSRR